MPIPKTPVNIRSNARATPHAMLVDAIVDGELAPGQRLHDEVLEERFSTTRSAIRAALFELETQWMVRIVPRRGTFVTDFEHNRGLQAVEVAAGVTMRAITECAGRLSEDDLGQLSAYRKRWLRVPEAVDEALRTSQEDEGLYGIFFKASGNPELTRIRDWVLPYVKRLRRHSLDAGMIDPHTVMRTQREFISDVLQGRLESAAARIWEETDPLFGEYDDQVLPSERAKPGVVLTRDLVADTIEQAILDGTLVPGEPLPETDLMAWLGVSHTPVRQALDALANRGLVEQQINRTARVATVDATTAWQTSVAYGVLVRVALRRAMRLDPGELLTVVGPHLDRYRTEPSTPVTEINDDVNHAVFEFSGAQVIAELSERVAPRLRWHLIAGDEKLRPGAIRLAEQAKAAIASNDPRALDRVETKIYDENPFVRDATP